MCVKKFIVILKMLFQVPRATPMYWHKIPPSNLEEPLPPPPPALYVPNTKPWTNIYRGNLIFREGKSDPKGNFFFYCYFLWLTYFLDLLSFLHELTIWTRAQEFCEILNIREILPSSRKDWFLLNTEGTSSVRSRKCDNSLTYFNTFCQGDIDWFLKKVYMQ